jgi:hypothetical protein
MLAQLLYFVLNHILQSVPCSQNMLAPSQLGELDFRADSLHVDLESHSLYIHVRLIVDT